ncbi:MAG: PorP/SprF family type IX secretion system membrane protein [Saprospiraceae bacterium]
MKSLILSLTFSLICTIAAQAQESGVYNHYLINKTLINPAATGFGESQRVFINYKNSYAGFTGTPSLLTLGYDGAVSNHLGLGAQVAVENNGAYQRVKGQLGYSYRFNVQDFKMGFGLTTEFHSTKIKGDVITDNFTDINDAIIVAGSDGVQYFDAAFGFYGEYRDQLFIGLSTPNAVRARISEAAPVEDNESNFFKHYNMQLGYRFKMADKKMVIEPSLLIRKDRNAPFRADINLKGGFLDDQLIGALTYHVGAGNGFGLLLGTRIGHFSVFYGYDMSFTDFQNYNNGSHEFTLEYKF